MRWCVLLELFLIPWGQIKNRQFLICPQGIKNNLYHGNITYRLSVFLPLSCHLRLTHRSHPSMLTFYKKVLFSCQIISYFANLIYVATAPPPRRSLPSAMGLVYTFIIHSKYHTALFSCRMITS